MKIYKIAISVAFLTITIPVAIPPSIAEEGGNRKTLDDTKLSQRMQELERCVGVLEAIMPPAHKEGAQVVAPGQLPERLDPFRKALAEAVHQFAEHGKMAHLRAVLERHPELLTARRPQQLGKPVRGDGYTLLQTAACHGQEQLTAYLLEKGADVNAADGLGYTPLHLAAQGGHLDVVKRLVEAGAKVDLKTRAIPAGVAPGGPAGAAPQKIDPIPARTALQIAENANHAEVLAFLKAAN